MKKLITILIFMVCITSTVFAHSGRTASDGCHYDRKTGIRHCH